MPTRARAHTSRRRTPARDSGVREPRRGPLPGVSNRPADAFRRRRSGRLARESGPSSDTAVVVGRAVVVAEVEPACGEAAFSAGAVKVNERRFDGPGVQRRRSLFASAVVDAGICERRTRLAGPLFRPAGCAVARAGVRRPSRGRRPSRPRDGGRTAVPGPAGGGVRPAGGAGVRSGLLFHPLRGRMGRLCVQANLSTWHCVSKEGAGASASGVSVRPSAADRTRLDTEDRTASDPRSWAGLRPVGSDPSGARCPVPDIGPPEDHRYRYRFRSPRGVAGNGNGNALRFHSALPDRLHLVYIGGNAGNALGVERLGAGASLHGERIAAVLAACRAGPLAVVDAPGVEQLVESRPQVRVPPAGAVERIGQRARRRAGVRVAPEQCSSTRSASGRTGVRSERSGPAYRIVVTR